MKKLILTVALTAAAAVSGFSQGQVTFQNAGTSWIYWNAYTVPTTNRVTSGTIASQPAAASLSTGVVDIGLYWGTAAFTDAAQGTLADTVTMSTTAAGAFAGSGSGALAITGTSAGENIYVQVFAWDSTYATPDAAIAAKGYFGAFSAGAANTTYGAVGAAQFVQNLTVSPAGGIPIFGTGAGQFGRDVLLVGTVPEPTTIALGGLGAAALLLFRRRK
jgi:hypothetical protein